MPVARYSRLLYFLTPITHEVNSWKVGGGRGGGQGAHISYRQNTPDSTITWYPFKEREGVCVCVCVCVLNISMPSTGAHSFSNDVRVRF